MMFLCLDSWNICLVIIVWVLGCLMVLFYLVLLVWFFWFCCLRFDSRFGSACDSGVGVRVACFETMKSGSFNSEASLCSAKAMYVNLGQQPNQANQARNQCLMIAHAWHLFDPCFDSNSKNLSLGGFTPQKRDKKPCLGWFKHPEAKKSASPLPQPLPGVTITITVPYNTGSKASGKLRCFALRSCDRLERGFFQWLDGDRWYWLIFGIILICPKGPSTPWEGV